MAARLPSRRARILGGVEMEAPVAQQQHHQARGDSPAPGARRAPVHLIAPATAENVLTALRAR